MEFEGIGCADSKRNQLPSCIGKSACICFEELSLYDPTFINLEDYAERIKKQIRHYLYLIHLHQNKEEITETNEVCSVDAGKIRTAVYFTDITRIHFSTWIRNHGDCDVILPMRSVRLSGILRTLESVINAWDMSIELFFHPESKIKIKSLKIVLETHHELIMLAERYCSLRGRRYYIHHHPSINFGDLNCIFY